MIGTGGPTPQDELISSLKRAIFMRESQQAATLFQKVLQGDPGFVLEGKRHFELARLLELGNEPNLALSAYQAILKTAHPNEEFYRPSLRAAGHLSYRIKDFRSCRTFLETYLASPGLQPNERADAEALLLKLPDGKGVRSPADIQAAQIKPQIQFETSELAFDESGIDQLNSSNASLAAPEPEDEADDSSRVQGINLYVEDVPEPPKPAPKRPQLAGLESPSPSVGRQLPPHPPKFSPYGELTPANAPNSGKQTPQSKLNEAELQGLMFGAQPAAPQASQRSSEEMLDKFAQTPPLSINSRDIRNQVNSEYRAHTTDRQAPRQPINDLPTTDEMPNPSSPKMKAVPRESGTGLGFGAPMFEPTSRAQTPGFNDRDTHSHEDDARTPATEDFPFKASVALTPSHATPQNAADYEALLEAYQHLKYALILPLGAKISVSQVAHFLTASEGLSDDDARKAVVDRKGCLRHSLTLQQAVELYQITQRFQQTFAFVVLRREFETQNRLDAQKLDLLTPGIRIHTAEGVKKVRWEKVRFITCGRLNRLPTVDLFVDTELVHYRIQEEQIRFLELYPRSDDDYNEACKEFLKYLTKVCPEAEQSHTVRNLLSGKTYRPQKFASDQEYDLYNLSLLLGHFGEEVPMRELSVAHSATSSAW